MPEMARFAPAGFGDDVDTARRRKVGVHCGIHGSRHSAQIQLAPSIDAAPRKATPHVKHPASNQHLPLSSRTFGGLCVVVLILSSSSTFCTCMMDKSTWRMPSINLRTAQQQLHCSRPAPAAEMAGERCTGFRWQRHLTVGRQAWGSPHVEAPSISGLEHGGGGSDASREGLRVGSARADMEGHASQIQPQDLRLSQQPCNQT